MIRAFTSDLDRDEAARSRRFHSSLHRERFVVAHGALRAILGSYLGVLPKAVSLETGRYGKPALTSRFRDAGEDLQFNLSHSGSLALVAVTYGRKAGVDLERIRADVDYEALAARFFAPAEQARLRELAGDARARSFFACWTRKEAYIKALGEGLAFPLDRFAVTVSADEEPRLLDAAPGEPERWSLRDLAPGPGYAGALAVEGHGWRLVQFLFRALEKS